MSSLQNKILALISHYDSQVCGADFIQLFQHQVKTNAAYSAYLKQRKISPNEIIKWADIPAIPTDAFKSSVNPTSFILSENKVTSFLTSGTTSETRGAHHFRSTEIYEKSIIAGWYSLGVPELLPTTLLFTPSSEEAPQSSLSHMMQTLKSEFSPEARFILSEGTLDIDAIRSFLKFGQPMTLIGTALAFLQLFDHLEEHHENLQLPAGSWAMETGGYKGSEKSLTKEELYEMFQKYLGLSEEDIWNEYSMTELSSQFYTRGIGAPHRGPAWTRIKVINPETMQAVESGEMGYLVIYDLANYDSCMAVMTQDLAIYHDEYSFTLIGRDPSALPRGCSRSL